MEPNRLIVRRDCPQCAQTVEMSIQVRYGPCAGHVYRLGDAVDWTREGALLSERSRSPRPRVPGLTLCPACERLALDHGVGEFAVLKPRCKRRPGRIPRLRLADDYRIGNYVAYLDLHHDLREPVRMGGDVITKPGRLIERVSELVLGYAASVFSHLHAIVTLRGDVFEAVDFFPASIQHALRQNPVRLHFGGILADPVALADLVERHGLDACLDGMFRVSLKLEMLSVVAGHREEPGDLEEVPGKLRILLAGAPYTHPEMEPLACLPRDARAGEILDAIERALPGIPAIPEPAEGEGHGEPFRLLERSLASPGR